MSSIKLPLVDRNRKRLGTVMIEKSSGHLYMGIFVPETFPEDIRRLCNEYQKLVEDQLFSALDKIETQIESYGLGILENGSGAYTPITDFQLTQDNRVSYRVHCT